MFGVPLHPLVVHFPIVLTMLLPIVALATLWMIRKGSRARRAWIVPLGVAAALTLSAWVALKTGETEEDHVRRAVPRAMLHEHEEAAERFLMFSGVLCVVTAAGLVSGRVGRAARIVATLGAVGLIAAGVQVGHMGGVLVYRYDAARVYADSASPAAGPGSPAAARVDRRE